MKWLQRLFEKTKNPVSVSAAALLVALLSLSSLDTTNAQKVLLRDVQTLTLHRGRMTTGRRSSPVPQLSCVGGNACGDYEPDVVQCTNAGFDGSDVQWKCQADLPETIRFGELDVYCEGYSHPDDPYVLKGSCGLEYNLVYTNIHHLSGKGDFVSSFHGKQWSSKVKKQPLIDTIYFWTWVGVVGMILFFMVKSCFEQNNQDRHHDPPPPYRAGGGSGPHGGSGGGGDGGGGGGGNNWGSNWGFGRRDNYPPPPDYKPTNSSSSTGGYQPGFWSGLGLGAGAAYLAANANRDRRRDDYYRSTLHNSGGGWGSSPSSGSYSGSSFGGSSSGGSSSTPTRSASGFGGTKRR
ncbi:Store-operated calcium entry-associated regulatory factor [Gryganskiella cystojenkinii]|nr:Store-operated calcium entry-associated regulatory factor [Gryganskiella cystojenkinii]